MYLYFMTFLCLISLNSHVRQECAVRRLLKKILPKVLNSHKFPEKVTINSSEKFEIYIHPPPHYHQIPLSFTSSDIYPPTPIVQDRMKYFEYLRIYFTSIDLKCIVLCSDAVLQNLCFGAQSNGQQWNVMHPVQCRGERGRDRSSLRTSYHLGCSAPPPASFELVQDYFSPSPLMLVTHYKHQKLLELQYKHLQSIV